MLGCASAPSAAYQSALPRLSRALLPTHPPARPPAHCAGLLKLVFATETLAAGINMPARTTLIAALSRRRDGGIGALQVGGHLCTAAGKGAGLALVLCSSLLLRACLLITQLLTFTTYTHVLPSASPTREHPPADAYLSLD